MFIPWKNVESWRCIRCGNCCRLYSVVIDFPEWLRIVKNYGVENTASGIDKLFIKRRGDGSCAFLNNGSDRHFCDLQHMKPKACQLWPFKILDEPKFGHDDNAAYSIGGNTLFVYVDSNCNGLKYGVPTPEFAYLTVKEFVEIAAGLRTMQVRTTSSLGPTLPHSLFFWPTLDQRMNDR